MTQMRAGVLRRTPQPLNEPEERSALLLILHRPGLSVVTLVRDLHSIRDYDFARSRGWVYRMSISEASGKCGRRGGLLAALLRDISYVDGEPGSPGSPSRATAPSFDSSRRLKIVLLPPVRDLPPQRGSLGIRGHEVEARVDPRQADLSDGLGEASVAPGDPKGGMGGAEGHPVRAEEVLEGPHDRVADAGVGRRVVRVGRVREERGPGRVGDRGGVAVVAGEPYRGLWPPEAPALLVL